MKSKIKSINLLNKNIDKLNSFFNRTNILEELYILGNKKEIIKRNLLAGVFRGVGIGIGVTLISAVILVILQRIVKLNIPIISNYIVDIIEIVQKNL